jgi:hypothetical protein
MFYAFTPTAPGPATGSTSGSWNGQTFSLTFKGNGGAATFRISPTAFDFGDAPVGAASPQQTVTITNVSIFPVVMNGAGGGAGQFGGSQNCQGTTLNPGHSCQMFYAFTPSALGPASGSTSGSWNGQSFSLTFAGNGIRRFRISPVGFDFGYGTIGVTSPQQTVTITNVSSSPVVMSGAGGGAGQFGGSQNCQGTTVNAGQSCHMFYAYTPTTAGLVTGSTSGSWNGQTFSLTFKGNVFDPFTNAVLIAGISTIRLVHLTELRERIDVVRVLNGLQAYPYADLNPMTPLLIRAQHIIDLRTALAGAYMAAGRTPPTYTDPDVTLGGMTIRTFHITQLRDAVIALEP